MAEQPPKWAELSLQVQQTYYIIIPTLKIEGLPDLQLLVDLRNHQLAVYVWETCNRPETQNEAPVSDFK